MSDLTFTVLRFAYLILLWAFVLMAIGFLRRDIFGMVIRPKNGDKAKKKSRKTQNAETNSSVPTRLEVSGGAMNGAIVPLTNAGVTIGRNPNSTLVINDRFVSSNHARLFIHNNDWYIEDLGSTNGTLVNKERLFGSQKITQKDKIHIGDTTLQLK